MKSRLSIIIVLLFKVCVLVTVESKGTSYTHDTFNHSDNSLEIEYEYIGKAVQKKDTHVWGTSPVIGKDGRTHLFVAEWPMPDNDEERFSGWYKHSRIAHYVGDSPEGPFNFLRIVVPDKDGEFNAPHNPTVQYIDGKYVLCFIVNENDDKRYQRIIMLIADDPAGEWRPAAGQNTDGTILRRPENLNYWNHNSVRGVTNPSLIKFRGKYMLYFKSVLPATDDPLLNKENDMHNWRTSDYGYGVALSDNLEGPYEIHPHRVTSEGMQLEDVFAFTHEDKVYFLSRDFRGSLGSIGGGLQWASDDGLYFSKENSIRAYEDLEYYIGRSKLNEVSLYRGPREGHLERAQLLIKDGKPEYLYVATGINDEVGYGSCSHVFRIIIK